MTTPAEAVEQTSALLEVGAIMLGTALLFVILFRNLGLGATLGYIVGGALIGPQLLGWSSSPTMNSSSAMPISEMLAIACGSSTSPSRCGPISAPPTI